MRKAALLGVIAFVFASGGRDADAMGGSGNLSPSESPYAILEPQTVTPDAIGPPTVVVRPASATHSRMTRRARSPRPTNSAH